MSMTPMSSAVIGGTELRYVVSGESKVNCLLFVGGIGMGCQFWERLYVPALKRSRYAVVAFERGKLAASRGASSTSVLELAREARDFVDHLGYRHVVVVGASLGALVAQEMAALSGRAVVDGLLLIATQVRQSAFTNFALRAEQKMYAQNAAVPREYMAAFDLLQACTWEELVDDRSAKMLLQVASSADYDDPRRREQVSAFLAYRDGAERLAGISAPAYVVGFEQDVVTPSALGREVADVLPFGRFFELPACGHGAAYRQRAEILKLLVRLLSDVGWEGPNGAST